MLICINYIKRQFVILFLGICLGINACTPENPGGMAVNRDITIQPDYTNSVIPPNIAPLNFNIREDGASYFIDIYGDVNKDHIYISQDYKKIQIPERAWRRLLQENRGQNLHLEISVKKESGEWLRFNTITNQIADENIDPYVVYRLINPAYILWWDMGIYQRCIENFDESTVFKNSLTKQNCMNCHAFCNNNPDTMMFHMRSSYSGTVIIQNGKVKKVNTATDFTMSAGVYPAWHPDGKHIAFSVNKVKQIFHSQKDKSIYVYDQASDLILYDVEKNMVTTSPEVSTSALENLPNWSPDGRYLYFCSSDDQVDIEKYDQIKYDLKRIACDVQANRWGNVETILSSANTGKSISFPKVSPDGKYLLCCMSDYGYFTIHFNSSDLYLITLTDRSYNRLPVNSDFTESYHSWSGNSRWFVFVSKRLDGLCSRLYFSHLSREGKASKPFLLPQKDPDFYDRFVINYNLPEMVKGPVTVSPYEIARIAYEDATPVRFDPEVDIDALSGASRITRNNDTGN